jgi:hypothetical protein
MQHDTTWQNILLWFSHARIHIRPSRTANDGDSVSDIERREYFACLLLWLHVVSVNWRYMWMHAGFYRVVPYISTLIPHPCAVNRLMAILSLPHTYRCASVRILAARIFTLLLLVGLEAWVLYRRSFRTFDCSMQKKWVGTAVVAKEGHFVTYIFNCRTSRGPSAQKKRSTANLRFLARGETLKVWNLQLLSHPKLSRK